MTILLEKSKQNIRAASMLIDNELYASSVHCSYYACFQRLKKLIADAYICDYSDLDVEHRKLNKSGSGKRMIGSHEFYINYKLLNLVKRENKEHRLVNELNDIKRFRKQADYDNISIDLNTSQNVFKKSNVIIDKLEKLL